MYDISIARVEATAEHALAVPIPRHVEYPAGQMLTQIDKKKKKSLKTGQ